MAIGYLRVSFPHIFVRDGAQKLLAYLGRTAAYDDHAERGWDFSGIARDLVFQRLYLPTGAPAEMADLAVFARLLDTAETRRMRLREARLRWPQMGAAFVAALPPDAELTFDETIELAERFVDRIRAGRRVGVYLAIHDPARDSEGAINRHAHLLVTLREIGRNGFEVRRLRDMFARPRPARGEGASDYYMAESINWPRLSREMQDQFFLECGLDLAVDPPGPVGHAHWSKRMLRDEPRRAEEHRQKVDRQSLDLCTGKVEALIDRLLRGRSLMTIDELRKVIVKGLGGQAVADERVSQILMDPAIVTLAIHQDDVQPSRVTLRMIHDLVSNAMSAVDRLTGAEQKLVVVSGTVAGDTIEALVGEVHNVKPERIIIAGQALSHGDELAAKLPNHSPEQTTIAALLPHGQVGRRGATEGKLLGPQDLIVVPRAEQVDDDLLARLIVAVERAHLLLGHDQSMRTGVMSCGLAARLADIYGATPRMGGGMTAPVINWLRCGLVTWAVTALMADGLVAFEEDDPQSLEGDGFVVCDDPRRLAPEIVTEVQGSVPELDHGPYRLREGQWVAFTKTDYSILPPTLRAGQLARIVDLRPEDHHIMVEGDGVRAKIDLKRFGHVEPVGALTIRQARWAPADSSLLIRLTKARYVWSCLVLASKGGRATVSVSPGVASNLEELALAIHRSLPAALPSELLERRDRNAELDEVFRNASTPERWAEAADVDDGLAEFEIFPEPASAVQNIPHDKVTIPIVRQPATVVRSIIDRGRLHDHLWFALESIPDAQVLIDRLEQALASSNADRADAFQRLLDHYNPASPMAALIEAIYGCGAEIVEPDEADEFAMQRSIDTAPELDLRPREWGLWEIYKFKMDVRYALVHFPLDPVRQLNNGRPASPREPRRRPR